MQLEMKNGQWWLTSLIPALGRQREADLCEFEASLVYRISSRTASKTRETLFQKTMKQKQNRKKKKNEFANRYK